MSRAADPARRPAGVIEFGQLLAGPFTGTLLGDFGADVIKIEAPADGRRDARLGPPAPQRPLAVVVDPGPQQALRRRSTCASPRASGIAAELAADADIVLENFRPGTMEKWGLGPEDVHARNPRADLRARVRLRPDRPLPRPARLRLGRRGDLAACATSTATRARRRRARASRSATRSPRSRRSRASCSPSTPATRAAPTGQVVDAVDHRRVLRDDASRSVARVREDRLRPRADRHRGCRASRPSNVYRSKRRASWVVIAANHDTLWRRLATLMGQPELGEDERFATHHARGEHEDLLDEIIGAWAARHTAEELDRDRQRGRRRLRAGLHGGGRLRGPVLPRARAARRATRTRCTGTMTVPGVVPKLSRTPGCDPPGRPLDGGRRHGRSAGGARSGRGGARRASRDDGVI